MTVGNKKFPKEFKNRISSGVTISPPRGSTEYCILDAENAGLENTGHRNPWC